MIVTLPDLTLIECGEIAVTAAEGGINYWAVVDSYDWRRWDPDGTDCTLLVEGDGFVFYTLVNDTDGEDFADTVGDHITGPVAITPEVIRIGFELLVDPVLCPVRKDLIAQAIDCLRSGEPGAVDADVADVIIQLGAFGEVVYG